MSKASINVTDHAIVRWFERVAGYDVAQVRKRIREECREAINLGAERVQIDGATYVFEGRNIGTVVTKEDSR